MPKPAVPGLARFRPAALPAGVRKVMGPLARGIEQLRLPPALHRFLPQPAAGWSGVESILQQLGAGVKSACSLPALLLAAKKHMHTYASERKKETTTSERPPPRSARPAAPAWDDWRAMVDVYVDAAPPSFSKEITWDAVLASSFDLPLMFELHQHCCDACAALESFEAAVIHGNTTNPCQFSVILAWLAGQWRLP
jgi:hypothetical protein